MTEIIAIDLMSLIYCLIIIPLIVGLSRLGWAFGKYVEAMWDLKWRKARDDLE
jgi:hypothetical protein